MLIYFYRVSFSLENVNILATSLTGVFPSDVCSRSIEDPASTIRLECPLNCDSTLKNTIPDSGASNDCGGFESGLCSDYIGWGGSFGYGCGTYEIFDDPGCPSFGHLFPDEDGIRANDACCHCGGGECTTTCFNTTDKGCTNDDKWTAIVDNEIVSCDWFEENDEPGCANTYVTFLNMDNVSDPRESCCFCSEYCQDLYEWLDIRWDGIGYSCDWYKEWDEPGCPLYGYMWSDNDGITAREACCYCRGNDPTSAPTSSKCYNYIGWINERGYGCDWFEFNDDPDCPYEGALYPNGDNITANDACCYCGGGELVQVPSASPTQQNKPTVTPSVTPTDKPSHKYEPTVTPSIMPVCIDYIGWVAVNGFTCDWFEANDDSECSAYGAAPNEDVVTGRVA